MDKHIACFVLKYEHLLSETAIMILEIISRHSLKAIGVSWMSVPTIANSVGITIRTVQNHLSLLENLNIISRVGRYKENGGQTSNFIVINRNEHVVIEMDELLTSISKTPRLPRATLKFIPYSEYLSTAHWKNVRVKALRRSGFKCQLCNKKDILDVHHRTYERKGNESASDVIALCRQCHAKFHDKLQA